jgi:hypothetical protein
MKKQDMTQRYRKFKRVWGTYYAFDTVTGNSVRLKTNDKAQAIRDDPVIYASSTFVMGKKVVAFPRFGGQMLG